MVGALVVEKNPDDFMAQLEGRSAKLVGSVTALAFPRGGIDLNGEFHKL